MYKDTFNYKSTAKLLLYGNDRPFGDYSDDGLWRRMKLIEFSHTIPDSQVNKHLLDDLRREYSGILNWALQGYAMWASNPDGLRIPDVIEASSGEYRRSLDTVATYLDYLIDVGELKQTPNPKHYEVLSDLMNGYKVYCAEQSLIPTNNPTRFKKSCERYFAGNPSVTFGRVARGNAIYGVVKMNPQNAKASSLSICR